MPAKNWVPFAKKPLLRQNNPVFPDASVDDLGERLVASQRGSQLTRMTKRSHFDLV
jgi:hypothetical protein